MSKCKPGDLAVVIQAQHKTNLGLIVKVLERHDRTGPLVYGVGPTVWMTESTAPMTWTLNGEVYTLSRGPIPDCQLQPIRALPARKWVRRVKTLEVV
jgi:hypothetical protein